MNPMHSLLKRQLRRFANETIPLIEEQLDFIKAINDAYWQFDIDRSMLEHSLELTSQELLERNTELSQINADLESRVVNRTAELAEAVRALAVERDLLQALMDNIPDTIYFKDADSRFIRINRAQARVLGVATPEAAIGKTDLDFFHTPDLAQSFYNEEQHIVETGESLINRIEFNPTPDGNPRWFSATKVPVKDEAGHVIGLVGISHDITKRKQVEEALKQSEERFKLMAWATKDAVWDWDLQTQQIWWGEGLQKIFHYSSETSQTNAQWRLEHIHPEDRAKVNRTINQALEGGMEFWSKEYRFRRSNGTYADIMDRGYIIRDDTGIPHRMIGAMIDITDRKQAEQALLESEARYRQIVQTAGDLIYGIDVHGRLTYINPTALRIMGFKSEEDVLGRHYLEFVHPAWRERVKFTYNQQVSEKILNTYFEFVALTLDRRDIWLGQTAQIVLENNRVTGFQVVGRDITSQKNAEMALQEANWQMTRSLNELQRRNREIALLNELSHLLQVCQSADEAYRVIADLSNQLFPGTAGAIYLLNPTRTLVSAIASWGELPSSEKTFAPRDCCAWHRGQTRPLTEDQTRLLCLHLSESLPAVSHCFPMQVQGEILGVLHMRSLHKETLDEAKLQLAYTVVEQTAMVLSNLKLREALREQSIRDPLTGLYNRRYMEEVLKQHMSHVTRHLNPLGVIMIDIDHFKHFNDTYGHATGDLLLRELSQFLQSHIRGEDIACRYGGEEFIVIMPDVSLQVAQHRAEHLRQQATKLRVQDAGQSHEGITLSLGVAIYPQHSRTIESVLRAADTALYRAKQEGRNCVIVAESAY